EGGRGLTTSRAHNAVRRLLVVSQVALAVVLFTGAALMVKSYARLRNVQPGFDAKGITAMTVALPYSSYDAPERIAAFWKQLSERVRAVPGVIGVGGTESLPLVSESGRSAVITDVVVDGKRTGACVPTVP